MTPEAANATILTVVPMTVEGAKTRAPEIYDAFFVSDKDFTFARDQGGLIQAERLLQDTEIAAIQRAIKDGRKVQSPAGIPGYDLVDIGSSRLIRHSRPVCRLQAVRYEWREPEGPYPGHWIMTVEIRLLRCLTPRAQVEARLAVIGA